MWERAGNFTILESHEKIFLNIHFLFDVVRRLSETRTHRVD